MRGSIVFLKPSFGCLSVFEGTFPSVSLFGQTHLPSADFSMLPGAGATWTFRPPDPSGSPRRSGPDGVPVAHWVLNLRLLQ